MSRPARSRRRSTRPARTPRRASGGRAAAGSTRERATRRAPASRRPSPRSRGRARPGVREWLGDDGDDRGPGAVRRRGRASATTSMAARTASSNASCATWASTARYVDLSDAIRSAVLDEGAHDAHPAGLAGDALQPAAEADRHRRRGRARCDAHTGAARRAADPGGRQHVRLAARPAAAGAGRGHRRSTAPPSTWRATRTRSTGCWPRRATTSSSGSSSCRTRSARCPGPFDCFLVLRGLRTLALRMERHAANALRRRRGAGGARRRGARCATRAWPTARTPTRRRRWPRRQMRYAAGMV